MESRPIHAFPRPMCRKANGGLSSVSRAHKPSALLIRDAGVADAAWEKLEGVLPRLADFQSRDGTSIAGAAELLGSLPPEGEATLFLDANWLIRRQLSCTPEWEGRQVVLVSAASHRTETSAFPELNDWRQRHSFLPLRRLSNADLPRLLLLALSPNRGPGLAMLGDRGSEIYFEKLHGFAEIGQKTDRVVTLLEKQAPKLSAHSFNLRQLSYSLLHLAYEQAKQASRVLPVVDFQCSANAERLLLAVRFNALPGTFAQWRSAAALRREPLWRQVGLAVDALALTEIRSTGEVEAKVLICREGDFQGAEDLCLLARSISAFREEAGDERTTKLLPLGTLPTEVIVAHPAAPTAVVDAGASPLALKVKVEMLEKETRMLQELVKKKSELVTGLQQDLQRAQLDLVSSQSGNAGELQKARLAEEKARSDLREATAQLERLKKANPAASAELSKPGEALELEKARKHSEHSLRLAEGRNVELTSKLEHQEALVARLREEARAVSGEINELKARVQAGERRLQAKELEETWRAEKARGDGQDADGTEQPGKLKELQRQAFEARAAEQKLEMEVKHLTARLEASDKNARLLGQRSQHEIDLARKFSEEAKAQKRDLMKKLEERDAAAKVKVEEWNIAELKLKRMIESLTAELAKAKKDQKAA